MSEIIREPTTLVFKGKDDELYEFEATKIKRMEIKEKLVKGIECNEPYWKQQVALGLDDINDNKFKESIKNKD